MRLLYLLLFLCTIGLYGDIGQNNDIQLWLPIEYQIEMKNKGQLRLSAEERLGANATFFYFLRLQGTYVYPVTDKISMGPGYRQMWSRTTGGWTPLYEPIFDTFFNWKSKDLRLQLRNRLAYRFVEGGRGFFRFRLRQRIFAPFTVAGLKPFLSEEVFFDSNRGFSQNRAQIGADYPVLEEVETQVSYMLRTRISDNSWINEHVFGLFFKVFY